MSKVFKYNLISSDKKPCENFFLEAKKKNIAIIARGPLASGLLSGNINKDTKFPENDHRNYNINGEAFDIGDTFSGVNLKKGFLAVKKLKKIIPKNTSLVEIALKWILQHKEVTVVIPGAINKEQVYFNTNISDIGDISNLMQKINSVYDEFIREDVHHKW